jgi:hypothetical protein
MNCNAHEISTAGLHQAHQFRTSSAMALGLRRSQQVCAAQQWPVVAAGDRAIAGPALKMSPGGSEGCVLLGREAGRSAVPVPRPLPVSSCTKGSLASHSAHSVQNHDRLGSGGRQGAASTDIRNSQQSCQSTHAHGPCLACTNRSAATAPGPALNCAARCQLGAGCRAPDLTRTT